MGTWSGMKEYSSGSMQNNETPEDSTDFGNSTNSTQFWYEDYFIFNACLLSLIFIIATVSNCWLSLALCKSRSLRSVTFNLLILHISLVCLAECVLNIPVSFYQNIRGTWNCLQQSDSVNEFTLQLIAIELTFGVCVMCIQRWLASWRPDQLKRHLSVGKQTVVIATIWIVGLSFSVPILSLEFDNEFYEHNFIRNSSLYIYLVMSFCYLLPMIINTICLSLLVFRRCKDIKNRGLRRLDMTYTEMFFEESYIWNEWESTKLLLVITLLYIITEIPYVVVQYLRKSYYYRSMYNNKADIGSLWLRYSLCCAYPLIIVFMRRDIRQKIGTMLPRRRSSNTRYERTWEQANDRSAPLLLATTAGIQFNLLGININDLKSKLWVTETSLPVPSETAIRPTSLPLKESNIPTKNEDACINFEDATEDEIDCSSLTCSSPVVREIAVQTSDSCPATPIKEEKSHPSFNSRKRKHSVCVKRNFVVTNSGVKKSKCLPRRFKVVRLKYYRVSLNVHLSGSKKNFGKERMSVLTEEEC